MLANIVGVVKRYFNREKQDKIDKYDPGLNWAAYKYCENHSGHLLVDCTDSWFCLKCWVGFFMGLAYGVNQETREAIINGTSRKLTVFDGKYLRLHTVWSPGCKGEESTIEDGGIVYLYNEKGHTENIITYEEAIKRLPDIKPHKNGGPPYNYSL